MATPEYDGTTCPTAEQWEEIKRHSDPSVPPVSLFMTHAMQLRCGCGQMMMTFFRDSQKQLNRASEKLRDRR